MKRPHGQAVRAPDFMGHGVQIPLEESFFQNLNSFSLHKAFHVHPSIVPIWLKYCWKGHKTVTDPSIHFLLDFEKTALHEDFTSYKLPTSGLGNRCITYVIDIHTPFQAQWLFLKINTAWIKLSPKNRAPNQRVYFIFHFSEVHRSMNASGHMQSKWCVNCARGMLHSYVDGPQKNEIHLLCLHFVFTSFLFIICEILI